MFPRLKGGSYEKKRLFVLWVRHSSKEHQPWPFKTSVSELVFSMRGNRIQVLSRDKPRVREVIRRRSTTGAKENRNRMVEKTRLWVVCDTGNSNRRYISWDRREGIYWWGWLFRDWNILFVCPRRSLVNTWTRLLRKSMGSTLCHSHILARTNGTGTSDSTWTLVGSLP